VNLGATPGRFVTRWLDPATLAILKEQKIYWKQAADAPCSAPSCMVCASPALCVLVSPPYDFDVLLDVAQQ